MADHQRITAANGAEFRRWLAANHDTADAVWLVYAKKGSGIASIAWSEAVDEALCFGWIDSSVRSIDAVHYEQYFTRRKPTSPWSKVNKEKVRRLELEGRIWPAGAKAIEIARSNGSWSLLDDAEALIVPADLAEAFDPAGRRHFDAFAPSRRRNILQWILLAKRADTRARRVAATAAAARDGGAPNGF